jgi:eukaryotic-like serine/threonine-protein kinase
VTEPYGSTGPRAGKVVGGKYRLTRRLGEGGMGEVYEAQHNVIGRRFAIKFLHAFLAQNTEAMTRFRHEAETAGGIEHENIGAALDFGTADDGTPYLVMEYLEGEDLAHLLVRTGPLPVARATYIVIQACRGLTAAHARGIVHRDLKPENLFVCRRTDGSDLVKVVDFGIAKLRTKVTVTQSGVTMGTPCYMSLEQAKGAKEVDHRTDIYALGVIMYEMLTGTRPYPGENYNEVLYNLFTTEPARLDSVRSGLPAGLSEVVHRAMAREARNRFDSADALADALVPYAGRPVTPLRSQIDIEVASTAARPARATAKSPVSLTSMETTPRPVPVTATPQRRETMNTDAVVRAVIPGRTRRLGIALLAAAVLTGPLAYALWWYLSPGWQPAENAARPPLREPRASAATQPPEKALASANPVSALTADAGPAREFPMPAIEPAPAATAKIPVERAAEPAHAHHAHAGHGGHVGPAESTSAPSAEHGSPRTAKPADAHGVRPAAARSENPTQPSPAREPARAAHEAIQPPPTPEYPDTPKKHVRHFDPDNPYGK